MVVARPPMGWNTWNTFGTEINEQLVKQSADILVESGLANCGYNYVVIDDCWSLKERDENGRLVYDPEKFPNGMKAIADYIHSKGLKFGMYSCAGMLTCAGYPGSYEHEWTDAQTFSEWGVDFLKYDFCFRPSTVPPEILYRRMALALRNCGRDILFSACSWGADNTKEWIARTGANMWRTTLDIFDNWQSLKELSLSAPHSLGHGGINCFADMDMLIVGMHGKGNVGMNGLTDDEYKMHFALWALFSSPLMIGCDIRDMDDTTKSILTNRDIIAINQDTAGCVPFSLLQFTTQSTKPINDERMVYAKLLENGDVAIGIFNFSDEDTADWSAERIELDAIGLPESTGKTLILKELFTGEDKKVTNGIWRETVNAHSCKLYRCKVVDAK